MYVGAAVLHPLNKLLWGVVCLPSPACFPALWSLRLPKRSATETFFILVCPRFRSAAKPLTVKARRSCSHSQHGHMESPARGRGARLRSAYGFGMSTQVGVCKKKVTFLHNYPVNFVLKSHYGWFLRWLLTSEAPKWWPVPVPVPIPRNG